MDDDVLLTQSVSDHFSRMTSQLRQAISAFPEKEWRKADTRYQRPAGLALHIIETIDFYTSGLSGDDFPWGERLGGTDWEAEDNNTLPGQEDLLIYLEDMEARLRGWLEETELSTREILHPWAGKTLLGLALYVLRHSQHHLGELGLELHRRGLEGIDWQ